MGRAAIEKESGGLREFMNSPTGKVISIILALLAIGLAGAYIWSNLAPTEAEAMARDRTFIDAKTMKPFVHELKIGDRIPVPAPSGGNTGYPGEFCYWTKDGKTKKEPTVVLLKACLGETGPTFCPDCGRLVVAHNPPPGPDSKSPPLESEYKPRGAAGGGGSGRESRR